MLIDMTFPALDDLTNSFKDRFHEFFSHFGDFFIPLRYRNNRLFQFSFSVTVLSPETPSDYGPQILD